MEGYTDGFIAKRVFDADPKTGLTTEIRCTNVNIDGEKKTIELIFKKVLVSPTGIAVETITTKGWMRFDDVENNLLRYTQQQQSTIGTAMKYVIETMDLSKINEDLSNFPACLEQGYGL